MQHTYIIEENLDLEIKKQTNSFKNKIAWMKNIHHDEYDSLLVDFKKHLRGFAEVLLK